MAAKSTYTLTLANLSHNIVVWHMTYTVFGYAEFIYVQINTFNRYFEGQNAASKTFEGHLTFSKAYATIVVWHMIYTVLGYAEFKFIWISSFHVYFEGQNAV